MPVLRRDYSNTIVAKPKNAQKPTISTVVNTNTDDATAGSAPIFCKVKGTKTPANPAQMNVKNIAILMTPANCGSLNHINAIRPTPIEKMKPFRNSCKQFTPNRLACSRPHHISFSNRTHCYCKCLRTRISAQRDHNGH